MAYRSSIDHKQRFGRRAILFGSVQMVGMSVLAARLYQLQFLKAEEYRTQAEGNRIKLQIIAPPRGQLLDVKGVPLADNQVNYRLLLDRDNIKQARESLDYAASVLNLSEEMVARIKHEIGNRPLPTPVLVKQYLSWDEVSKIQFHAPHLTGMQVEEGQVRHYPLGELAAHVIGYVGRVTESEMEKDKPVMRLPEFKIGKDGCEVKYDLDLRGKEGSRQVEVDASGRVIRQLSLDTPLAGTDFQLTLDMRLQTFASERLRGESGAIIVMEVPSGAMKCLVSMPAYDPNEFSKGITHAYWNALRANKKNPLLNKALAGQYPPGSTFKMLTGLAALHSGKANPYETVYCPGHFYLGSRARWNCWRPEGHGSMNLFDAVAQSCDTYFYTMAHRIGMEKIAEMCHMFGLGERLGPDLPNEKTGIVPTSEWKKKSYNQVWVPGDTINASIGQGYVLSTPLQLAVMTARMATGKQVLPQIRADLAAEASYDLMDVKEPHLDAVRQGMVRAVNNPVGTAYWKRIKSEGHEMAGKTGTSQVRKITVRGQDQSKIPWELRHHGLFVGYAPVNNPRYVVSVIVEHGGGGSSAAAPVARDVLAKMQELEALDRGVTLEILEKQG